MTALPAAILTDALAGCTAPARDAASARDESAWVRAAQTGDAAAFRRLMERHQEALHRFCWRWLHCEEDAREVCQDAFVRAWQALPAWEPRAQFSTWLYRIALNLCRDRARSRSARQRSRTQSLPEGPGTQSCPRPGPDASAEWRSEVEKLHRGLDLLPDDQRAALVLTAMEGLSHTQCAEILGCGVRGVEGRIYRARQRLVKWWESASGQDAGRAG